MESKKNKKTKSISKRSKSLNKQSPKIDQKEVKLNRKSKSKIRSSTESKKANDSSEIISYMTPEIESKIKSDKKFIIEQWKKIEIMRNSVEAPVDTMGVECCPEENLPENQKRFQFLVSLLLSSQTKDNITFSTVKKLAEYGFTIEKLNKISEEKLAEMLYGVSFHNTKAKNIKAMTEMIISDYDSMPPNSYKEVVKLPGIGPKMGNLFMQSCFGVNNGIAVDTHVHRISKRLKWVLNSSNPEKTRIYLEQWLPVELFSHINTLLVGFGQTRCKAVKPQCEDCLLNDECEFGIEELASRKLKSKRGKRSKVSGKNDNSISPAKTSKSKEKVKTNSKSNNKVNENDDNVVNVKLNSKDKEKSYINIEAYKAVSPDNKNKFSKNTIVKFGFKDVNDSKKEESLPYAKTFSKKKKKLKIEEEEEEEN